MKKSMKGQDRRSRVNNSPGMLAIVFVTMLLLGTLSFESRDLAEKLAYLENKSDSLQREIEDEKQRTQEIDALREYMQTDAYMEQLAREKLGLVKDNEIIFIEAN